MRYHVLGPLQARSDSGDAVGRLTAAKPQKLFALLLLHANLVVPADTLIEELWGYEPPATAAATLQTYVMQVRRMLTTVLSCDGDRSARDVLLTACGGYSLNVAPGELDLHDYERLVADGRQALHGGDDVAGAKLMGDALALWHGNALADVRLGPVLRVEVGRLEEVRLAVRRERIAADLRAGGGNDALGELGWLAARHPRDEDLHAQYMLALYTTGRRADALEAFLRLRNTLRDDLGLEPSPQVQRLQRTILVGD
ncbi:AfsR/SARP family transcriptional regulator [Asanoa siamensis]|uniref:OmpR/PhoB-type domain-containing protein n=1 Tax=Asanoa siamensis TaxID=926357 RepID=A0ABQ4CXE0_9ACTN|nr:AfsR/SARP family transcriptional regulator [Asanoa siamensis]GIF75962.1 hypothetical protein Asi02nite_54800 [Asanoa siamensis]